MARAVTLVLALLAYVASTAAVSDMHGSDAAGNGLAPVCAVSNFVAIALLMDNFYKAKWPLAVPVLLPLLLMLMAVRPMVAPVAVWGALAALAVVPWPSHIYRAMYGQRDRDAAAAAYQAAEPQRQEDERRRKVAAFEKLDDKSPLHDWLEFTYGQDSLRDRAIERIRRLPRRQADAEEMMRQGLTYIVRDLPDFDLQATPPICEGTRRAMRELVADMKFDFGGSGQPLLIADARIQQYKPGIEWAVEHGVRVRCRTGGGRRDRSALSGHRHPAGVPRLHRRAAQAEVGRQRAAEPQPTLKSRCDAEAQSAEQSGISTAPWEL